MQAFNLQSVLEDNFPATQKRRHLNKGQRICVPSLKVRVVLFLIGGEKPDERASPQISLGRPGPSNGTVFSCSPAPPKKKRRLAAAVIVVVVAVDVADLWLLN
jgi:hypothetical protein